jgi:hypothetical protein|tara:strand:+ start:453 stop:914 length:462 start_codon:yes stop_codon:yes gene_type:complete
MKKLLGILVLGFVFVLTTAGFFKSDLEECADISMKDDWQFVQTSENERVDLTPQESNKQKKLLKIEIKNCDLKYKNKGIGHTMCVRAAKDIHNPNYKWKIIRNISPEENNKKYKKFISQSLKKKMKDPSYTRLYADCIKYKKWNPELFKAKYD